MSRRLVFPAVAAPLFLMVFVALWLRPRPIVELRPANVPIALRGTDPEPELTAALAESAERADREGRSDWFWTNCVDAVAVFSLPVPADADDEWRAHRIQEWAAANSLEHGIYKEGGDVLFPRNRDDFEMKVLPAADRRFEMQPFERAMMNENPDKLLVLALEFECPDPDPPWKRAIRRVLASAGAR